MMVKNDLKIIHCGDKNKASQKGLRLLLRDVDDHTLLLLSGGTSPDLLYRLIAQDKTLKPGAVALIDERFGLPMHDNSNEKMIAGTNLLEYFNNQGVPFYGMLKPGEMEDVAEAYGQVVQDLFGKFPKKAAITGIGSDGHTAGVKPGLDYDHTKLVVAYNDAGSFGKRIILTFEALSKINEFLVLAFGEEKKQALQSMFSNEDKKYLPVVFYTKIPAKTFLLTDVNLTN